MGMGMGENNGADRHAVNLSYLEEGGDKDDAEGEEGATDRKFEDL